MLEMIILYSEYLEPDASIVETVIPKGHVLVLEQDFCGLFKMECSTVELVQVYHCNVPNAIALEEMKHEIAMELWG